MSETELLMLAAEIERADHEAHERAQSDEGERETLEYVRIWARDAYLTFV